jgi:ureidoglycolate lyase
MNNNLRIIEPIPLHADHFSRYGDVIDASKPPLLINQEYTKRYDDLAEIDVLKNGGRMLVNIFRSTPLPLPLSIRMMERHPLSSQAFVPLSQEPYLVVVAPPGDFFEENIEVFLASGNQGVNYRAGTWHHFLLALNSVSDFLVIDRGSDSKSADDKNCDEVTLSGDSKIKYSQGGIND